MAFQGSKNEHLGSFPPHSECKQLHRESFSCTRGSNNRHVCVFVDTGIEDIHDYKAVVVLVYTQQYAILVGHLIGSEGIAARSCRCKNISLTSLKQFSVNVSKWHDCGHGLLLSEAADAKIHVL